MSDLKCPYCEGRAIFHSSSSIIYNGQDYGPVYTCEGYPLCDAYVGCHPGTSRPLGRLANKDLRYWKKSAHFNFDKLWRDKIINDIYPVYIADTSNRNKAYIWLSKQLGIKLEETHIGMFDVETCKRVVEICKPYINE